MDYRLLVEIDVIRCLDALRKVTRQRLLHHLCKIRESPDRYSDFHEFDSVGRRVEISVVAGYAIHYWIDFPDRHVKVLAIVAAG